jgi:hypothetical protein
MANQKTCKQARWSESLITRKPERKKESRTAGQKVCCQDCQMAGQKENMMVRKLSG